MADALIREGRRRRDVGVALAASRRPDRVTQLRLRLLRHLLASPAGRGTIDDATAADDLTRQFTDGGKWRGSALRSLLSEGLVRICGITRSRRPSRHAGYVAIVELVDRPAAARYVRLTHTNEATSPAATGEAAASTLHPPATETEDGSID
jgi:hypothetical protein